MVSFYPGPSRVYDEIPSYVKDAHRDGILSMNHRSPAFMELSKKTVRLLKSKLDIPKDYTVFFTSSATECWEVIAQSLVTKQSIHIFNGAFGEKWYDYTHRIRHEAMAVRFGVEALPDPEKMRFTTGQIICLTQNETSNGTQIGNQIIAAFKKYNPNHLIAVDATSSMAGIHLDFSAADVWFASVQKCFGLPAGLGVMMVSPKAMESIREIKEARHYNSLTLMADRMTQWQTPSTPNVLAIYLLMRTLQHRGPIRKINQGTKVRATEWYSFFKGSGSLVPMVANPAARSLTVLAVKGEPSKIEKIKKEAARKGFLLGEGYGSLRKETFRIANFPALKQKEIAGLMKFLTLYL